MDNSPNAVFIEDNFYNEIKTHLKSCVPTFVFDETDEVYLILLEFSQFMIANINNAMQFEACCHFINCAVDDGQSHSEDAIVQQIFQPLYAKKEFTNKTKPFLNEKAVALFEKYLPLFQHYHSQE